MKVAVSIPDDVFATAEALARQMRVKRSSLYALAIAEFAARQDVGGLTEQMNAALDEAGDPRLDYSRAAARRAFANTEW